MPAFGLPTRPTSAITFSSSRRVRASPGSPGVDWRGARLVDDLKRRFPLPPLPPSAATTCSPAGERSFSTCPCSASITTVPGGTGITQIVGRAAVAVGAGPRLAVLGLPQAALGQGGEAIDPLLGDEDDAAAVAAVAAVGSAAGDVLLPAEADAAVAPFAGLHLNLHLVDEHKAKCTWRRGRREGANAALGA